jgi:hypothetical protein
MYDINNEINEEKLLNVYNSLLAIYKFIKKEQPKELQVFACLTKEYVCKNCYCPTEDYSPYDWEQPLRITDTIDDFVNQIEFEIINNIGVRYLENGKHKTIWF